MARTAAQRVEAKLRAIIERACKMLAIQIDKELRRLTPIDTHHAQVNWVPSVGSPHAVEVETSAAHDAGIAAVLAYKIGQGTLYIQNNTPYIRLLNEGWSDQAPAMFVEIAIIRAMNTVKRKTGIDLGVAAVESIAGAVPAGNLAEAYSPFAE